MENKYPKVVRRVGRLCIDWLEEIPGINRPREAILAVIVMLSVAGLLIWSWLAKGPGSLSYALALVCWTYGLGLFVAGPVMRILPRHWFHVSPGEHVFHRMLGVGIFGWLIERSGYNRNVSDPMRGFKGTKAGLPALEQSVRANASAKITCFAVHIVLATVALLAGHSWSTAMWILLPGVVVHLYPLLLQRSILLRIQPLLNESGS